MSRDTVDEIRRQVTDASTAYEPIPVDLDIVAEASRIPRDVLRDPWDRLIAATAIHLGLPLVTSDGLLRRLDQLETIW